MVGLLIEQEGRVAQHAHVLEAAGNAAQVDLGEPALPLPLVHQAAQNLALLPIRLGLLRGHGNAENLVRAFGKFRENLFSRAPQQNRLQLRVNAIQAAVAEEVSLFVLHAVFLQEPERGTQAAPVDELHHREELFQFVFERGPREYECVAALQLLDGARRGRNPIADALGLVQNDQVRLQFVNVAHVFEDQFIAGEVEERG